MNTRLCVLTCLVLGFGAALLARGTETIILNDKHGFLEFNREHGETPEFLDHCGIVIPALRDLKNSGTLAQVDKTLRERRVEKINANQFFLSIGNLRELNIPSHEKMFDLKRRSYQFEQFAIELFFFEEEMNPEAAILYCRVPKSGTVEKTDLKKRIAFENEQLKEFFKIVEPLRKKKSP